MRKKKLPPKPDGARRALPRRDSEETRSHALNYSLKYLSYRPRSIKEVFEYLDRKNFAQDSINTVLKKLIDLKFLDDRDFARQWIESRQKYRGKSKFVIKMELRKKGLTDETIEPLLRASKEDLETARELFEKQKNKYSKLSKLEFRNKMGAFLQRRGFTFETISKLLRN